MSVFSPYTGSAGTDKLFLEYILPGLNVEIKENTRLYDRFKTDTSKMLGKYAVFKCLTASPKSVRPSSTSSLPTPKQGTYNEFTLFMKRGLYAQLQFDGLAVACGQGKGAVKDLLQAELQGITIQIGNKLNRQFWGDGSGRLAIVKTAVANSTTCYVDALLHGVSTHEYTDPGMYLDEGQSVDIYDSSGNLEEEDVEISTMSDDEAGTNTLTMASAITCSANSYIFDHDTYAASRAAGTGVPMGLWGIIETADPYSGITSVYFQGIQRSANAWARGQVVAMGSSASNPSAITNTKILKTVMKAEDFGRVKVMLTNPPIWRAYYEILEADKSLPNEKAFWGGLTGLTFYGGRAGAIPVVYDPDCPDQSMMMVDDSGLAVYSPVKNGMAWLPGDSGILSRVQGKDEWVASLVWYYNFGTPKPQALAKLEFIKHASS